MTSVDSPKKAENQKENKIVTLLSDAGKVELSKILAFGEKIKAEGEIKKKKFWEGHGRGEFFNLINQYEESEQKFINGLSEEEKKFITELQGKSKEKYYKQYLHDIILYSGDSNKDFINIDTFNTINSAYNTQRYMLIKGGDTKKEKFSKFFKSINQFFGKKRNNKHKCFHHWITDESSIKEAKKWKGKLKPGTEISIRYGCGGLELMRAYVRELKDSLQPLMIINIGGGSHGMGKDEILILAKEWKKSLKPGMVISSIDYSKEYIEALAEEWKDSLQPRMNIILIGDSRGSLCLEGLKTLTNKWKNSLQPGMIITIRQNKIGAEGAKVLAEEWKNSLQPGMTIDLTFNYIGDDGAKALAEEWKDSLQPGMTITLDENEIGVEGAKALAECWKDSLQPGMTIILSGNKIGAEGAKALAECWKNSLQPGMTIVLSGNKIGAEGIKVLAECWKDSLQPGMTIVLSGNKIGAEGTKVLAECWKDSLQPGMTIDLKQNDIGAEGTKVLAECWKDSLQSGMTIDLSYNSIGNEGVQAIKDNLEIKEGVSLNLSDERYFGLEIVLKTQKEKN